MNDTKWVSMWGNAMSIAEHHPEGYAKDVESFDDKTVFAMPEGLRMTVKGKDLKVTAFSAESGKLCIEGEIDSVTYAPALSRKAGFFAKIFR